MRDAELHEDVFAYGRRRGRRQRQHGRIPELLDHFAEVEIGRPEVVSPLRDTVGLINHEKRDAQVGEHFDEGVVLELFGRHEDDLHRARCDAGHRDEFLLFREGRIERDGRVDAEFGQHVELIFHQRDQRRDDDRGSFEEQGRELIAQRFSGTRRKDCQRVLAGHDPSDDLFLALVEVLVTELLAQRSAQPTRLHRFLPADDIRRLA